MFLFKIKLNFKKKKLQFITFHLRDVLPDFAFTSLAMQRHPQHHHLINNYQKIQTHKHQSNIKQLKQTKKQNH